MSNIAIQANKISKAYVISTDQAKPDKRTLQEDIIKALKRQRTQKERIWALKDVSFEINHGEVVGIIGRNGAGKTTLLKVLSRITEPTSGYADIYGRIGSLLEVGTGFHSELTGRENIFLSGAVLGMTRTEIRNKFDEIVDFSGVEKFLETPVKRYSSGMQVRLAFSVAAHLDPEILLIDEVLAVGDAEFQKKCLGKMDEVAHGGRTILFVSHNMSHIQKLCQETIIFDSGKILFQGSAQEAIPKYLSSFENTDSSVSLMDTPRQKGFGTDCKFTFCAFKNSSNNQTNKLRFGESFTLSLEITTKKDTDNLDIMLRVESPLYPNIINAVSRNQNKYYAIQKNKNLEINVTFQDLKLNPGDYHFSLFIVHKGTVIDKVERAIGFTILEAYDPEYMPFVDNLGIVASMPTWD
ncbi:MAG: ABC transporter ATP-binding protein [Chloroflexi bacterium]|nr:ABC transporter ATP-binding protein [Chloroflexota bacterium]